MRKQNELKAKLKKGDAVLGIWCVLPSPPAVNVAAASGMDFVIIDLEHGPLGPETAEDMVRAAASERCCSIVRLGQKDEGMILKALDMGAQGVLVAHVESRGDAEDVVAFSKYWPLGNRGFSPYTRAGGYGVKEIEKHAERQNEYGLTGIILEGREGIRNLDSILKVRSLDLVYVGAYDLSQALGVPGQVRNPRVMKRMETSIRKIRDAGIAAGGYVAADGKDLQWMLDMGMQFITVLPDCALLHRACSALVEDFRKAAP